MIQWGGDFTGVIEGFMRVSSGCNWKIFLEVEGVNVFVGKPIE